MPKVTQLTQNHIRLHSPGSSPSSCLIVWKEIFSPLLDSKVTLLHRHDAHIPGELSKHRFPHSWSHWGLRFCTFTQYPGGCDAAGSRTLNLQLAFPLIPLKRIMNIDMMTARKEPQAQIQQGRDGDQGELWVMPSGNLIPMLPSSSNFQEKLEIWVCM